VTKTVSFLSYTCCCVYYCNSWCVNECHINRHKMTYWKHSEIALNLIPLEKYKIIIVSGFYRDCNQSFIVLVFM